MIWLTNFYDFRFKWTATAAIGIHPTKSWLSQSGREDTLEERYSIKFCFKLLKNCWDNKCTVWCQCGNCTHNYSRGTEDVEDLREVCPKGVQRRSERKTFSWQLGDDRADQFRSRSSWCFGDLWWKLDLLLWPRDQETEFQTQEGQTEQTHPKNFDNPFFWQLWHDLHALGSHWIDSQQGILCWSFKGVHDEIRSEEANTLQIGSVAFPPGQSTSLQLHPSHGLFDQYGHQDSSSPSL